MHGKKTLCLRSGRKRHFYSFYRKPCLVQNCMVLSCTFAIGSTFFKLFFIMHFPCNIILKQWKKIKKNDKIKMISALRNKLQHLSRHSPKQNELLREGAAQQFMHRCTKSIAVLQKNCFCKKQRQKHLKNIK